KRFLRGFFDTDGSISCQRNYSIKNNKYHTQIRIYLVCISKNLITEIAKILEDLGFKYIWIEKEPKSKDGFNRSKAYGVKICGGIQVSKWFKEIGSTSAKHVTKYNLWKKFGFCPPYTTLEDRKKMLKNQLPPYYYYRECTKVV
ncbi:MAG: LAGLIDADG family homing endonuclease, partial [archaeon]